MLAVECKYHKISYLFMWYVKSGCLGGCLLEQKTMASIRKLITNLERKPINESQQLPAPYKKLTRNLEKIAKQWTNSKHRPHADTLTYNIKLLKPRNRQLFANNHLYI